MQVPAPIDLGLVEFKRYRRDVQALVLSLALPVALIAVMVGAFGGSGEFSATASIVDLDQSERSGELIQRIADRPGMSVELLEPGRAAQLLEDSQRLLVTFIAPGYGQWLGDTQTRSVIEFRARGGGGDEGRVVAALVRTLVDDQARQAAALATVGAAAGAIPGADIDAARDRFRQALDQLDREPLVGVVVADRATEVDAFDRNFSGILTMIIMFTVATSVATIVAERENGTMERLLTTRLGATGLYQGKYLGALARGFAPALLLTCLAWIVNRSFSPVQFGQILVVGLLMAAAAAGVGMLIAGLARSQAQANWSGVTLTMVMATLGGSFFAADQEGILDWVGYLTINRYANDALRGLIEDGNTLADHALETGALAAIALALLLVGRLLFSAARPGG